MTRLVLALMCAVTLRAADPVSAPAVPTISDSLHFSVPSSPQISPDGSQVVYQRGRTNDEDNAFESDLWLADTRLRHRPHILNAGKGWNGDPQWSPDGRRIAFVSDRSGKRQIFVIAAAGGESRKLTRANSGVEEFHWAPDGKSIAFTASNDTESDRLFEVVRSESATARLWRVWVDVPEPHAEEIPVKQSVGRFSFSPDGGRIAFESDGIFVLDLANGNVTPVASGAGPYRHPLWSPDGKNLVFETAGGNAGFYYSNWYIALVSATGGTTEPLTQGFDENADLYSWTTAGIYFGALQRTASHLFLLDPATHKTRRVTSPADSANFQFSLTPDGARFAFVRGEMRGMPEIYVSKCSGSAIRVTDTAAATSQFRFAQRETVQWTSTDGVEIEGILMKPADFDPHRRYPLLVVIHGGPAAVDQLFVRADRTYPLEQFVAEGALVLRPNYRGSAGYGSKLRALAVRNLGTGDAADVISGVDSLIAKGFVDPSRVGAMGWSEGGYVAAFLGTATDRFSAVSVGAGISDWTTYYVNTDITPFTRQYLKATPWDDPEAYRRASPITYIRQAKTPVLIQHGDQDSRVPIANAYELRQALEDRQVPVRMIVFKGMGHSINRPKQQQAVMEQNLQWFREWVLDAKTPRNFSYPVTLTQAGGTRITGDSQ